MHNLLTEEVNFQAFGPYGSGLNKYFKLQVDKKNSENTFKFKDIFANHKAKWDKNKGVIFWFVPANKSDCSYFMKTYIVPCLREIENTRKNN